MIEFTDFILSKLQKGGLNRVASIGGSLVLNHLRIETSSDLWMLQFSWWCCQSYFVWINSHCQSPFLPSPLHRISALKLWSWTWLLVFLCVSWRMLVLLVWCWRSLSSLVKQCSSRTVQNLPPGVFPVPVPDPAAEHRPEWTHRAG